MSYKKKLAIMGVLFLTLLAGLGLRLVLDKVQGQESQKKTDAASSKIEAIEDSDETDKNKPCRYKNLDGLYFLDKREARSFQSILENWMEQNKYSCTLVTVLGNISSPDKGAYKFYVQLDDGQGTILETSCKENKGAYAYTFKRYVGDMKDIGLMGGTDKDMERAVTKAPADGYVPVDKPTDDSDVLISNPEKLPKAMDAGELKANVLKELKKQDDLRRAFTVKGVKEEQGKIVVELTFQTQRPGTTGLKTIKDLKDGAWSINWEP